MWIILATACLALACVLYRFLFWCYQGRKVQTSGYLPPPPGWLGRTSFLLLSRFAIKLLLGPCKVIGKENAQFRGRSLVLPNHQHGLDFAVVRAALPFSYRQIGAAKEMKGYRAMPAAFWGSFSVPVQAGKAQNSGVKAAMEACVRVLALSSDSRLLMFPQGKLVFDNVLRREDFRTGAVRVMRLAVDAIPGQPILFLPVAVYYGHDLSKASAARRGIIKVWSKLLKAYRSEPKYGVTVAIGEPIDVRSLPADLHAATEVIRGRIQELLERARSEAIS